MGSAGDKSAAYNPYNPPGTTWQRLGISDNKNIPENRSPALAARVYEYYIQHKIAEFRYQIITGAMSEVGEAEMGRLTADYERHARNRMRLPAGVYRPGSETANNAQNANDTVTEDVSANTRKRLRSPEEVQRSDSETANYAQNAKDTATEDVSISIGKRMKLSAVLHGPDSEASYKAQNAKDNATEEVSANASKASDGTLTNPVQQSSAAAKEDFETYACRMMKVPKGTKLPGMEEIKKEIEGKGPSAEEVSANRRKALEMFAPGALDSNESRSGGDTPTYPMIPSELEDEMADSNLAANKNRGSLTNDGARQKETAATIIDSMVALNGGQWAPIIERDVSQCSVEKMIAQRKREGGPKLHGLLELMKTTTEYDDLDDHENIPSNPKPNPYA